MYGLSEGETIITPNLVGKAHLVGSSIGIAEVYPYLVGKALFEGFSIGIALLDGGLQKREYLQQRICIYGYVRDVSLTYNTTVCNTMSQKQNITLEKGHSQMITSTVTGMDDWEGISAKLFIVAEFGNAPDVIIEGVIVSDSVSDRVEIYVPPEATLSLEAGTYHYEIALYNSSNTYIRNTNHGDCILSPTISDLN